MSKANIDKRLALAGWATKQAIKSKADEARVSVNRQRYVSLEYRDRRVEKLEEATTNSLSLTLYIDGRYSQHRTSDLRKDALAKFIQESVAMTRYLATDPARRLPESKYYSGRKDRDLGLRDSEYHSVEPSARHTVAKAVEAAALAAGGAKVISVTGGYYDTHIEAATVASNGFEGTQEQTAFWAGAEVTAKGDGDKRPVDWWWQGGPQRSFIEDPKMIGKKAALRALARIGSEKLPTQTSSIIIENRSTGRLLGWLGQALSGRNLQQKSSFLEGKKGEQFASPALTITDDPFVEQGQSSRLYDGEGMTAKVMPLFEKGVLKNYYLDTFYARKLEVEPTTGSPSNSVFALGDKDQAGWMKELGKGILITGFLGGNSNSNTGDFSAGIQGFQFEGGEIVKPVAELNIAGNHLSFWKQLLGLGNDPYPFSSRRSPCLVFEDVVVSGT